MTARITRRSVVKSGLMAGTIVPALGWIGNAATTVPADLPPLDPKEPAAVTLGFIIDAAKVDTVANLQFAPGQTCANCEQYVGKATDARGGCVLFPGKSVPGAGWCKVWRKTTKA